MVSEILGDLMSFIIFGKFSVVNLLKYFFCPVSVSSSSGIPISVSDHLDAHGSSVLISSHSFSLILDYFYCVTSAENLTKAFYISFTVAFFLLLTSLFDSCL